MTNTPTGPTTVSLESPPDKQPPVAADIATGREDECNCAPHTCDAPGNEGRRCWRSGYLIAKGYFSSSPTSSVSQEAK